MELAEKVLSGQQAFQARLGAARSQAALCLLAVCISNQHAHVCTIMRILLRHEPLLANADSFRTAVCVLLAVADLNGRFSAATTGTDTARNIANGTQSHAAECTLHHAIASSHSATELSVPGELSAMSDIWERQELFGHKHKWQARSGQL